MKPGRLILLALVVGGVSLFVYKALGGRVPLPFRREVATAPVSMVPPGVRIKVEVLNATRVPGLARRATTFLRDRGFDVVDIGTSPEQRGTTLVLDRSNHAEWARLVGRALNAKVESRPDDSRYLDVTVLLGNDWRPSPLPFYP